LRGALHGNLRGQYVTAAYLWLDTQARTARYAAAGHPPLILWRAAEGRVTRVESNGLLFGVESDSAYPACEIAFAVGDRFQLYTDGLIEPENAAGEPFGDARLERVLSEQRSRPAEELSRSLLAAVRAWAPASVAPQDDITLLVIDVLEASALQRRSRPSQSMRSGASLNRPRARRSATASSTSGADAAAVRLRCATHSAADHEASLGRRVSAAAECRANKRAAVLVHDSNRLSRSSR
jgi:hypothetical protein